MKNKIIILFSLFLFSVGMSAQSRVRVYGYVIDTNNRGIEFASVFFANTNVGTTTNQNGYYELTMNVKDSATLVYWMLR